MNVAAAIAEVPQEDRLRADLYNYLGLMLAGPPDQLLLDQSADLSGDETDLGQAINGLARVAKITKPKAVRTDYNDLFQGLGRGELLPFASYYLTGFLNEKPLANLRATMADFGMTRANDVFEPEDNIASLMEMMAGMIVGRFGRVASVAEQQTIFNAHISTWATHYFNDLQGAKASILYASIGAVGLAFMEIEKEAFRMSAS